MTGLRNNLPESEIIRIWQYQLLDKTRLVTEEGEPIEIIYAGRINDDSGADFRDAVIATSRGIMKGDVEIHVRSSDWRSHQHHRNISYNQVILHVVMWSDIKLTTSLQNGGEVPTLALNKYVRLPIVLQPSKTCFPRTVNVPCGKIGQHLTDEIITRFLEQAGEERFITKVTRLQRDLSQMEAKQSLYRRIMEALGYSKNKLPFRELADHLPLRILESITREATSAEECLIRLQALLLGSAGLLPSQSPNQPQSSGWNKQWRERLEKQWISSPRTQAISGNVWHLFKVRPNNSPVRRLMALSFLILRYRENGLLPGLVNLIKEAPVSRGFRSLEKWLQITVSDLGVSYPSLSSDNKTTKMKGLSLLGRERAADIMVNVLLPFMAAWSRSTAQTELEKQARALYRRYPRLAVNTIERHMRQQLGINSNLISSARQQQGLIHIYHEFCTQGRCRDCSLSQF